MMTKNAAADSLSKMARAILTLHYVLVTVYLERIKNPTLLFKVHLLEKLLLLVAHDTHDLNWQKQITSIDGIWSSSGRIRSRNSC